MEVDADFDRRLLELDLHSVLVTLKRFSKIDSAKEEEWALSDDQWEILESGLETIETWSITEGAINYDTLKAASCSLKFLCEVIFKNHFATEA